MTFIRYIGVDFTFGLLDCVHYNEDFFISRFYSIHFTVTLAGRRNIVRYTKDFVIQRFVRSRFHCSKVTGERPHHCAIHAPRTPTFVS